MFRNAFVPLIVVCTWAFMPGRSYGQSPRCVALLTQVLAFDPRLAPRLVAAETAISLRFAERIHRLSFEEGAWRTTECQPFTRTTNRHLYRFMEERMEYLLRSGQLTTLHHELALLRPIHRTPESQAMFRQTLPGHLEGRYLAILLDQLSVHLSASIWVSYLDQHFNLTEWNAEWRAALGTTSVAAAEMSRGRVALDPFALPPDELEYFLFHELAHLYHWQYFPRQRGDLRASETYAWDQTLQFIQWREARGDAIPAETQRLRRMIQGLGLPRWTEAVLRARGLL